MKCQACGKEICTIENQHQGDFKDACHGHGKQYSISRDKMIRTDSEIRRKETDASSSQEPERDCKHLPNTNLACRVCGEMCADDYCKPPSLTAPSPTSGEGWDTEMCEEIDRQFEVGNPTAFRVKGFMRVFIRQQFSLRDASWKSKIGEVVDEVVEAIENRARIRLIGNVPTPGDVPSIVESARSAAERIKKENGVCR